MASGRPIIASDLPSIRNIVDEKTVWFFEADSPASLSKTAHEALSNTVKAEHKSGAARKEVQRYSWENRISSVKNFINKNI